MNVNKIVTVLVCMYLTIGANAQRPVWLVGHGCNSHRCLQDALIDGANGVEIDVNTLDGYQDSLWTVAHDVFLTREQMKNRNIGRDPLDHYVTLKDYLLFPEVYSDICILWIDVKESSEKYLLQLIDHVHSVVGNHPEFAIIYGLYNISVLESKVDGEKLMIDCVRDKLSRNEGISLAYEGSSDCSFDRMEKLLKDHHFPIEQHMMTWGCCQSFLVTKGSRWQKAIEHAQELRAEGRYCGRIGYWTSGKAWHSWQFYDTAAFGGYKSDCDLVLAECRNEMIKGFSSPTTLKYTWEYYLKPDGAYYKKYNNGKCRIATRNDVFFR